MLYKKDAVEKECYTEKRARIGVRVWGKSVCKEDDADEGKKMAQGKIARRLASARLNAFRCDGGKTPFSHYNVVRPYAQHREYVLP